MQPGWDGGRQPLSAGGSGGFAHPRELGAGGWVRGSFEIPQKKVPLHPLEVQRNQPDGRAFHPYVPLLDPLQFPWEKPVLPEEAGGAGWALGRSGWHHAQQRGEGPC